MNSTFAYVGGLLIASGAFGFIMNSIPHGFAMFGAGIMAYGIITGTFTYLARI